MSKISEKKVQEAFETIKKSFEEKLGHSILSIHEISFITADKSDTNENAAGGFNLLTDSHGIHEFTTTRCRRIGGQWVCPKH